MQNCFNHCLMCRSYTLPNEGGGACVLIINIQVYVNVQNTLFFYAKIFVGYFFSFCCLNRSQWNSREFRVFSNGHTNSSSRNIIIIIECERKKRRKHVENVKRNNPKKTIWTNKMNEWDGRTKRRMCTMWMVSWHLKIVLDYIATLIVAYRIMNKTCCRRQHH